MIAGLVGRVALDGHTAVPFIAATLENPHGRQAHGLYARNRAQAFRQLLKEELPAFGRVAAQRRVDLEPHQPVDREAGTEVLEVIEAADEQAGPDQQQQRQRDLRDDQSFSQTPVRAADHRPGLIFQRPPESGLVVFSAGTSPKTSPVVTVTASVNNRIRRSGAGEICKPESGGTKTARSARSPQNARARPPSPPNTERHRVSTRSW